MLEAPQGQGGKMSEKYCDADKRECKIYLSSIYNLNCQRCGYLRALADAKAALENNVVRFSIEINGEWLINQKDAIAAIEALEENNG